MSESKDAHYLVAAPFVVINAEDGEPLRPGSRCVVEIGKREHQRQEREREREGQGRERERAGRPRNEEHSSLLYEV